MPASALNASRNDVHRKAPALQLRCRAPTLDSGRNFAGMVVSCVCLRSSSAAYALAAAVDAAVPRAWYWYAGGWCALSLAGVALQSYVTGLTPEQRAQRARRRHYEAMA